MSDFEQAREAFFGDLYRQSTDRDTDAWIEHSKGPRPRVAGRFDFDEALKAALATSDGKTFDTIPRLGAQLVPAKPYPAAAPAFISPPLTAAQEQAVADSIFHEGCGRL